ncbi:MAG: plasmid pRiA4b ORF-3 family protein [Pseudonocardia sp.]|nr:plasmid pRiA4b ORF-3 family protein [Pseudonocardia sp.]
MFTVLAAAQQCAVMTRSRALATWVGAGKDLTAKGVLRRADVARAADAIGIEVPSWVRTAADIDALHRPWVVATAAGWLRLDANRATATGHEHPDPAEQWLRALRAVLNEESHDDERVGARILCELVLRHLPGDPTPEALQSAVHLEFRAQPIGRADAAYRAFRHGETAVAAAVDVLVEFGAVDRSGGVPSVTSLGRWALSRLDDDPTADTAGPVDHVPEFGPDHVYQLKIGLRGFRPPVWRRVLVPADADLGALHLVIRAVLNWDDDHLHVFTADRRCYSDPFFELDGCADENGVTLAAVAPRAGLSLDYRYDLGDCWDHTITVEKIVDRDPHRAYPMCVTGRGDAPVEDWDPDGEGPGSVPFDIDSVHRALTELLPARA